MITWPVAVAIIAGGAHGLALLRRGDLVLPFDFVVDEAGEVPPWAIVAVLGMCLGAALAWALLGPEHDAKLLGQVIGAGGSWIVGATGTQALALNNRRRRTRRGGTNTIEDKDTP